MLAVLYFGLLIIFFIILVKNLRYEKYQITPLSLFYILLMIDVILPAFLYEIIGMGEYPPWYGEINKYNILSAVIIFILATLSFTIGYKSKIITISSEKKIAIKKYKLNYKLLYFFYFLMVAIFALNTMLEIRNIGGWDMYYDFKVKRIYLQTIESQNFFQKLLFVIASKSTDILILLNSIMFYNRYKYKKNFLWGVVFPFSTFFFILTSLHRGTILNFFISLMVVEIYRLHGKGKFFDFLQIKKIRKKFIKYTMIAVFCFLLFGTIRGSLNSSAWGGQVNFIESLFFQLRNNLGVSLLALARVIKHFSGMDNLLFGKTVIEMFYFFVPRSIFISKPIQYGIITATKAMGSPSSTMDAITMPGEMIANFGMFGILLVYFFGYFYKWFKVKMYTPKYISIYATLITSMTVVFWMSFTGLFSQMIYLPLYIVLINLLYKEY